MIFLFFGAGRWDRPLYLYYIPWHARMRLLLGLLKDDRPWAQIQLCDGRFYNSIIIRNQIVDEWPTARAGHRVYMM